MLKNNPYLEDFHLAQKICKELLNQNKKAIQELFYKFQKMFVGIAKKRLYSNDPNQAESILSNFWVELLNANAICNYKAQASLKRTFGTLFDRSLTIFRYPSWRNKAFWIYFQSFKILKLDFGERFCQFSFFTNSDN